MDKNSYMVFYKDELDYDAWKDYRDIFGLTSDCTSFKLSFNIEDIDVEEYYED